MSQSRWSILAILVLSAAGVTFAQASPQASTADKPAQMHQKGESAEQHLQMLSDKLNLTDDQKAKLSPSCRIKCNK